MKNFAAMLKPFAMSIALLALIGVGQSVAFADPLAPGTVIPGPGPLAGPPGTLLASSTQTLSPMPGGNFTATLTTAVYRNAGGTLDFYYQLSNSSSCPSPPSGGTCDPLTRLTAFEFDGFTTDVFARSDDFDGGGPFVVGTQTSTTADRSLNGNVVGFNFGDGVGAPPSSRLEPGETSFTFVIRTNAVDFTTGGASAIDGGSVNFNAFQPTVIPEPTTMLLLGTGLAGVAAKLRRRRKSAEN